MEKLNFNPQDDSKEMPTSVELAMKKTDKYIELNKVGQNDDSEQHRDDKNLREERFRCPMTIEELDGVLKVYLHNGDTSFIKTEDKENFIDNVSSYNIVREYVEQNQNYFDLLFSYLSIRRYGESEIKNLINNLLVRFKEVNKNLIEVKNRKKNDPVATSEEYNAGTYKESIETQVRDAVFELQRKGYKTFESGFDDLVLGTQYIGIRKDGVDIEALRSSLPKKVELREFKDRLQIVFRTKGGETIEELKKIWDYVVSNIPDNNKTSGNTDNGLQGVEFREIQDKINKGEDAWLMSGLAFVNGRVVEMTYQDFMKNHVKKS